MGRDPAAGIAQRRRLELGDRAVGGGPDVEQQVPALRHDLGQQRHDLAARHVVFGAFGAVVAEAVGDPSTQLPRLVDDAVGRLVLVHRDVRSFEPPPVVDDDLGVELAGGVDQNLAAPVVGPVAPVTVTPQELRAVALDEVEHVGMQHAVDVLVARIPIVTPVEQRVVRAEHESRPFTRGGVLGEHVAAGPVVQHRAIGARGIPPAQAVVVLGHEHRVSHAGVDGQPGPGVGIEAFERQQRPEVVEPVDVGPAVAVVGEHLDHRGRVQEHVRNGIAEMAAVPVGVLPDRRPCRHRRQVGVDEHARSDAAPTTPACSRGPILAGSQRYRLMMSATGPWASGLGHGLSTAAPTTHGIGQARFSRWARCREM